MMPSIVSSTKFSGLLMIFLIWVSSCRNTYFYSFSYAYSGLSTTLLPPETSSEVAVM